MTKQEMIRELEKVRESVAFVFTHSRLPIGEYSSLGDALASLERVIQALELEEEQ